MNGIYDLLNAYRQKNDPRFIYDGLYEEPAYTGPNLDPMYNIGQRQFGNIRAGNIPINQFTDVVSSPMFTDDAGLEEESYEYFPEVPGQTKSFRDSANLQEYFQNRNVFGGIMDLLGNIPTPFNLARKGIAALSDRAGQFFQNRRDRESIAARNMAQARGIQKGIDRGDFDGPNRADRDRGSVTTSSAASSKGVGGGGYTASDSNRESYRG